MNCHRLSLIILIWELVNFLGVVSDKTCALDKLFECPDGEICEQVKRSPKLGFCRCPHNYIRISPNSTCILKGSYHPPPPVQHHQQKHSEGVSVSAVVGGVVTVILLIGLAISLVFAAKKYRWVHRARQKAQSFRTRHYDTVLVNREDDPPLA